MNILFFYQWKCYNYANVKYQQKSVILIPGFGTIDNVNELRHPSLQVDHKIFLFHTHRGPWYEQWTPEVISSCMVPLKWTRRDDMHCSDELDPQAFKISHISRFFVPAFSKRHWNLILNIMYMYIISTCGGKWTVAGGGGGGLWDSGLLYDPRIPFRTESVYRTWISPPLPRYVRFHKYFTFLYVRVEDANLF